MLQTTRQPEWANCSSICNRTNCLNYLPTSSGGLKNKPKLKENGNSPRRFGGNYSQGEIVKDIKGKKCFETQTATFI